MSARLTKKPLFCVNCGKRVGVLYGRAAVEDATCGATCRNALTLKKSQQFQFNPHRVFRGR